MKKYIFPIVAAIFMSSCATIPALKQTSFIDFSPFDENGLFVTPGMNVPFEYTTLGKVTIQLISGYEKDEMKYYTHEDAIRELSEHLKKIGADGCMGLDYSYQLKKHGDGFFDPFTHGYDVTINGYAIKRK